MTHTASVVTVPSTAPPLVGGFNASPTRSPHYGDGRIDDPDAGWKGRGYWASFSTYATWHIEGGRGEGGDGVLGKAVKFQMRPDPLAR